MTTHKNNSEKNLEEVSAASGGAMSFSASKQEEVLRDTIRRSIRLYSKTKKNKKQENLQEDKIREIIRVLINEAKQSSFPKPESTLQGILSKFFNSTGMYETIRDSFYELQTNEEEKIGFIRTFLERANEILSMQLSAEEPEEELKEEDEEPEQKSREEEILDKWGAFTPSGVDKDLKKLKVKSKSEEKKEDTKDPEDMQVDSFEARGANSARAIFEQRLQDELRKIMLNLIGDEKEQGRVSIMQNFAAWFDMWTEDSDEMTGFLSQELEKNNVPLPPGWENMSSDSTEGDVATEPELAADSEEEDITEPDLEEDLFELLDTDLA